MLSTESFASAGKKPGLGLRGRWVRLRLHARRLASIGANAVELRGLMGALARLFSWLGFLGLLLWGLLVRTWHRIYRVGCAVLDSFIGLFRHGDSKRHRLHDYFHHIRSLTDRRQRGRTASVLMLATVTVLILSACCFNLGFRVTLNGQHLGFVESRQQVEQLVERVEDRVTAYLGTPYHLNANFSYTLRYMDRTDLLDEDLLEQRLFSAVGDAARRYILTVDGETIGACESRTALELMLRRILRNAAEDATRVNTSFVNEVVITETTSAAVATVPIQEMEQILTANRSEIQTYTVKSGDTVSAIGQEHGMTVSEIKELNPDLDESRIYIGQELMLSGAVPYLSVQQTITEAYTEEIPYETLIEYDSTMYTNTSKLKSPGVKGSADVIADVTYVNGKETARDVTSYTVTAQPVSAVKLVGTKERPRYMATGTFIKPSNGRFSSGFGYRPNLGDRHTGVDFAGSTGTNIWASDGGVVIHSGWKGNFGYCVYIDHQNGYVTVYAHCSKLLVKKGDKVAQGDLIAKVGNTGRSFGSHVHFEIRKNGKSVNPLNYINK